MKYKITYLPHLMAVAFVRIADDAVLYTNDNEMYVRMYAQGYCDAMNTNFYIE